MAVFILDRLRQPIDQFPIDAKGQFKIPEKRAEKAAYLAIGPKAATQDYAAERAVRGKLLTTRKIIRYSKFNNLPCNGC